METVIVVFNENDEVMGVYPSEEIAKGAIFEAEFHWLSHIIAYPDLYESYYRILEELADKNGVEPKDITMDMFLTIAEKLWDEDYIDWRIEELDEWGRW